MIKAIAHLKDGKTLVVLGMSSGNVREMKRDNPIVFNLASLRLPCREVCIAWKHDDGAVGLPEGFTGIGLCFSSEALDAMQRHAVEMKHDGLIFFTFVGETEAAMEQMMRQFCDDGTQVTRSGFSPSDLLPWGN